MKIALNEKQVLWLIRAIECVELTDEDHEISEEITSILSDAIDEEKSSQKETKKEKDPFVGEISIDACLKLIEDAERRIGSYVASTYSAKKDPYLKQQVALIKACYKRVNKIMAGDKI